MHLLKYVDADNYIGLFHVAIKSKDSFFLKKACKSYSTVYVINNSSLGLPGIATELFNYAMLNCSYPACVILMDYSWHEHVDRNYITQYWFDLGADPEIGKLLVKRLSMTLGCITFTTFGDKDVTIHLVRKSPI